MSSTTGLPNYFADGPTLVGGVSRSPLGAKEIMQLPIAEVVCCQHVNAVLGLLSKHTHDRFRLVILDESDPDASCFSRSCKDIGEIRLTTGLLSLACALAARCAVIMDQHNFLVPWMPQFAREPGSHESLPTSLSFGRFKLGDGKREVTGLTDDSVNELAAMVGQDFHLWRNTVRLASTVIEFLVLHEMGHFDALHDEVLRVNKAKVSLAVQRVFEHQADIFSIRLMLALGILRPVGGPQGALVPANRTGTNILAYLGASVALSMITLLRARDPTNPKVDSMELIRSVKGHHPLPTTRLVVADRIIQIELKDHVGRNVIWPGSGEMEAITLKGMAQNTMFLGLTTLSRDWQTAVNAMNPQKPTPTNVMYWLQDDEKDVNAATDCLASNPGELANSLIKSATTTSESAEFSTIYSEG